MIYILTTKLSDRIDEDSFFYYLDLLPMHMQQHILKYVKWQDRQKGLLSKLLLRKGLSQLGFSNDVLSNIEYTEYNKPYIKDTVDFNIASSGNVIVCSFGQDVRVGIDIEQIRPLNVFDFKEEIHPVEWDKIWSKNNRLNAFFDYWTRAEAAMKADGRGLNIPLKDIIFDNKKRINFSNETWFVEKYDLFDGYASHIASNKKVNRNNIIIENIEWKNIESFFKNELKVLV